MKSLVESLFDSETQMTESLFDKDLVSEKLPIEKEIKYFRNKDIAKMSIEDIRQKINSIIAACDSYTYDEFKKHPVDLLKHVVILPAFSGEDVNDYVFVYSRDIPNWGIETEFASIEKKTKNWAWKLFRSANFRFKDWNKKVDYMRDIYIGSNVRTFYVLSEILSKDLIKNMRGK